MLIKIRRSWEMPESAATPEHLFFDRRALLKGAGAIGAALALRRKITERPPLLSASLGELRTDREALERGLAGAARDAGDATSTGRSDAAGGAR